MTAGVWGDEVDGRRYVNGGDGRVYVDELTRPFVPVPVDLTLPVEAPQMLTRRIYRGGLHANQGEPGCGKSWLAAADAIDVMAQGYTVAYFDEENGPAIMAERLKLLGADPALVAERFRYYPFESRVWSDVDLQALDVLIASTPKLALAVFDSLADVLAAAGLDEDRARDCTVFVKKVCDRFKAAGVAVLLLDHVAKPSSSRAGRSRYSRGSSAKLAKLDACFVVEVDKPFSATSSGRLNLWCSKDRRGRLELPHVDQAPRVIDVEVDAAAVRFVELEQLEVPVWDGPTACMAAVVELLTSNGVEMTSNELCRTLPMLGHKFKAQTIRDAAERLALKGEIVRRSGPNRAKLYSVSPVRPGASQ